MFSIHSHILTCSHGESRSKSTEAKVTHPGPAHQLATMVVFWGPVCTAGPQPVNHPLPNKDIHQPVSSTGGDGLKLLLPLQASHPCPFTPVATDRMTQHYFVILLFPPLPFEAAKSMLGCCGQGQPGSRCAAGVHTAGFPALSSVKESGEAKGVPEALPIAWPLPSTAETVKQNKTPCPQITASHDKKQ